MRQSYLLLFFIGYLVLGSLFLRLSDKKKRDLLFCVLNVLALALPVVALGYSLYYIPLVLVFYGSLVVLQFFVIRLWGHRSGAGTWISILLPISCLVILRCVSGTISWNSYLTNSIKGIFSMGFSYLVFRLSLASLEYSIDPAMASSFSEFSGYAFFAPVMLLGPITSYRGYLNSYRTARPLKFGILYPLERMISGGAKYLFLSPIFYRVSYEGIFGNDATHPPVDLFVAAVSYYLYIFCNFSGFCDIAIGAAALIGIQVDENFKIPLMSRNIADFWNRWHITLSAFMRELLFTPMSKELTRLFGPSKAALAISLSILSVFAAIGIWHGTAWNYLLFGLFHGVGMVVNYLYGILLRRVLSAEQVLSYRRNKLIQVVAVVTTFLFVSASFFFFANDVSKMKEILSSISI